MQRIVLILIILLLVGCGIQPPAQVVSLTPYTSFHSKTVYIVKPSDTLYSIARNTGVNYATLARINDLQPPFTLYVGQQLFLRENSVSETSTTTANRISSVRGAVPNMQFEESIPIQQERSVGIVQTNKQITTKRIDVNKQETAIQTAYKSNLHWHWPVKGPILSRFAVGSTKKKNGLDIGGNSGLLIKAAASGKVVYSGSSLRGYGNLIIVKHNNNFITAYAHNRKNIVAEGAEVKLGQPIAEMGNTGTNKVMLHFEIRYNGIPVDPYKLLSQK